MDNSPLQDPWLVAAWPGMGAVAQIAATFLLQSLETQFLEEVPSEGHFDIRTIAVQDGLVQPAILPRSALHAWRNPEPDGHDLILFVGDQQPTQGGYAYCTQLLDICERMHVSRIHTFAAMATPMHPANTPEVFAAVTRLKLLEEVAEYGGRPLRQGEVGGLNGVLLAAAATREIDGICLLGEFPFFASRVPNPKAAQAVLHIFTGMAGIDVDLSVMDKQIEALEARLVQAYESMQPSSQQHALPAPEAKETSEDDESEVAGDVEPPESPPPVELDRKAEQHIEALFEAAQADQTRALELKALLDLHGVFKRYEDRFLDLFRKAD